MATPDTPLEVRVLVVDDDEANRESLSRRLRRRGMIVDLAEDGTQALRQIDAAPYDLILLDVMMPGISGIDVLQTVRQTRSSTELPVVMATANDGSADIAKALELGANDYITKPIDFTVALARINTQLDLGRAVKRQLQLQNELSLRNAKLENAVEALRRSAERLKHDLELAARVQSTFLPRELPADPRYQAAWRYLPCDQLAGDALNICPLGPNHVAFYVLDVSGHGVASSLTAVTAARMMSPAHDPASILISPEGPVSPAEVLNALSSRFSFDTISGQFITCFYALLNLNTGQLDYAAAGHPDAIIIDRESSSRLIAGTGIPIGFGDQYDQQTTTLHPGDRVWLYSDGVIEAMRPDGTLYGIQKLLDTSIALQSNPLSTSPDELLTTLSDWTGGADSPDDVSIITVELSQR